MSARRRGWTRPAVAAVLLCGHFGWHSRASGHDDESTASGDEYTAVAHVSSAHPEAASTADVHASDIVAAPVRTAEDALRQVPGFTLVQHGSEGKGQQYFLRGFDAQHGTDLEVTLEGVPLNEWSNLHAQGYLDLAFLIPELIQRVEVIKGPFELEQGAFAMAGSARYSLAVAEEERGLRASYTLGTTLRQRILLSYAPRAGDGDEFVALELMDDPSYGQRRAARRASATGRVKLMDSRKRGQLALWVSGYAAEFALPGALRAADVAEGRIGFYDSYYQEGEGQSLRGLGVLGYTLERAGHSLRANVYGAYRKLSIFENFTGALYDAAHGDYRDQRHRAASFGGALQWSAPLTPELRLVSGLGVRADQLVQREGPTDRRREPVQASAPDEVVHARRGLRGSQMLGHAQLGLAFRPNRALHLLAGTRADWVHADVREDGEARRGRGDLVAFSPRAVANVRANRVVKLFAAYGRGLRPPDARSFAGVEVARQGLSEEAAAPSTPRMTQSHAIELGARLRPIPIFGVTLSGFATRIARESVFDHVSRLNLELNGTRRLGGELVASLIPLPWLSLSVDATLVDARFRESGRRVPLAPWLTSGLRVVMQHPSGARAGLRFVGVAPRTLPHGARGEALYLLDATLGYRRNWFDVSLALENLLFRQLREGEYHFPSYWPEVSMAPRSELPTTQLMAGPPFTARLTASVTF